MFVISIKTEKKKILILFAALLLVIVSIAAAMKLYQPQQARGGAERAAATNGERIAFLTRYGWNVEAEPLEIRDITIPLSFNDVYVKYNEIQIAQDMDLLPFAGKRCKQWIYRVTNHPKGEARATLIIYENRVVGGDVASTAADGFMTGFAPGSGEMGETVSSLPPQSESAAPSSSEAAKPTEATTPTETAVPTEAPVSAEAEVPADASVVSHADPGAAAEANASAIPEDAWPTD